MGGTPGGLRAALLAGLWLAASPAPAAAACAVTRLEGDRIELRAGDRFAPLAGREVPEGATLRTGPGTRAELRCPDGPVLTIGPETEVDLAGLAAPGADGLALLALARGILGLDGAAPAPGLAVATPLAIASVRSTAWVVAADPSGTAVFVRAGRVAVTAAGSTVTLGSGEGADVQAQKAPDGPKRWGEARIAAARARLGLGWR